MAEAKEAVETSAQRAWRVGVGCELGAGGTGAKAYAEAVSVYLAFAVDYAANYWSQIATPADGFIRGTFARQALPMTWDFAEAPPFGTTSGNWLAGVEWIAKAIGTTPAYGKGEAEQSDASTSDPAHRVVSTDPPYYDNIAYADLSDFFYVWLRRTLGSTFPTLFATLATPKDAELVASPYRHGGKANAERFFVEGMVGAMSRLAQRCHPALPVTIYYAFKQSEATNDGGIVSTGWETFLDAVISAGFTVTGTWPMRTERGARAVGLSANVLASSIILVCRERKAEAPLATRGEFVSALREELPTALSDLRSGNIAPVDLAQAAIGPGMAAYTRYARSPHPQRLRGSHALARHHRVGSLRARVNLGRVTRRRARTHSWATARQSVSLAVASQRAQQWPASG